MDGSWDMCFGGGVLGVGDLILSLLNPVEIEYSVVTSCFGDPDGGRGVWWSVFVAL